MANAEKKFETMRTRELLTRELDEADRKCVSDVEQYGCHVIDVSGGEEGPRWCYSVGVYDTCGKPEIVVVGLKEQTAMRAVNYAVDALRAGTDLTIGRHREIVGEVEVVFRPVDPAWTKELMGWTKWYQGSWDFPVLQMIYPDLQNRFQWEEGFAEYFRQPLLQADAVQTVVEEDFRASTDPDSSLFDWKFPDPPHTKAFLSKTVHKGEEAITYVGHNASDQTWEFLGDQMASVGIVVSCLHHPIDGDATLKELADLPLGWYAVRDRVGDPWAWAEIGPEDAE